jgi:mannosyltransferase OCH1-like enzyme
MIPKFIHHIWIGKNTFPPIYTVYLNKWKSLYPDYNFIFWNDELVESTDIITDNIKHYYYSDCNIALKTDLLRFKILEKFGGIYVDADTEPLKRMPDDILKYNFFSGYQPNNEIAIGIMGSRVRESLVTFYIDSVLQNINKFIYDGKVSNEIWKISGPEFFTQFLNPYLNNPTYKFFEVKYFYPYAWWQMERKQENFSITSPESYSVHHWAKSWIS